jgi:hypothetical protein
MDKRIKIGTLVGAALLLVAGIVTHGWYTAENNRGKRSESIGLGLWGTVSIERCRSGACQTRTVDISSKAKGSTSTGLLMGKIGFIAGLLGAAALLVLAIFVGTSNPNEAKLTKGVMSLMSLTLMCGVMFLTLVEAKRSGIGYSVWLFIPGVVGGMVGAQLKTAIAAVPAPVAIPQQAAGA